jgi:hypothetical protein
VLIVGAACYLLDVVALFLVPDIGDKIKTLVVIPSAIAEVAMVLYLLVIGIRTPEPAERILAAA